jgi:hypothetical protein
MSQRHSHRCLHCKEGFYCYKQTCRLPHKITVCRFCKPTSNQLTGLLKQLRMTTGLIHTVIDGHVIPAEGLK